MFLAEGRRVGEKGARAVQEVRGDSSAEQVWIQQHYVWKQHTHQPCQQ